MKVTDTGNGVRTRGSMKGINFQVVTCVGQVTAGRGLVGGRGDRPRKGVSWGQRSTDQPQIGVSGMWAVRSAL